MKKISIITPSLNQGDFIEQTIDSVLGQKYEKIQFIIIDGGSTDGSVEIIKKYEKHLHYWTSESDLGQSHAINKGLKIATGDIVNWLNSDDYLAPDSLRTINDAFQNDSVNVFSGTSNVIQNGVKLRQTKGLDVYENDLAKTIGWARIDQPETFWRRSVVDQIGPLNVNLHFIMDRDWWIKYLLHYGLNGIAQTEEVLANFRLHSSSKTVGSSAHFLKERNTYFYNLGKQLNLKNFEKLFQDLNFDQKSISMENNSADKNLISEVLNQFCNLLAQEYYAASDWDRFRKVSGAIDMDALTKKDKIVLENLHRKTKLIPSFIHRALKK